MPTNLNTLFRIVFICYLSLYSKLLNLNEIHLSIKNMLYYHIKQVYCNQYQLRLLKFLNHSLGLSLHFENQYMVPI